MNFHNENMTKPFDSLVRKHGDRAFYFDDEDAFIDINTCFEGISDQF